jgi:lysophospholipase L1-like esterase
MKHLKALIAGLTLPAVMLGVFSRAGATSNPLFYAWEHSVYVVGDSLTCDSMAGKVINGVPTANWTVPVFGPHRIVVVNCRGGVPISAGLTWIRQEAARGGAPPTSVLALGTNDSETGLAFIFMLQAEINQAETLNPSERIFVVNYDTIPSAWANSFRASTPAAENAKNAAVNLIIGINVTKFHRNISLIDWQATMAPYVHLCPTGVTYTTPPSVDRSPCFVDGVHPDEAGYALRAQMIRNALGP